MPEKNMTTKETMAIAKQINDILVKEFPNSHLEQEYQLAHEYKQDAGILALTSYLHAVGMMILNYNK